MYFRTWLSVYLKIQFLTKQKSGPKRKLPLFDEFIMISQNKTWPDRRFVADIFGVSNTLVTKIFVSWTAFLACEMQYLIHWPSRDQIKSYPPQYFKNYPNTRVIIDCTKTNLAVDNCIKLSCKATSRTRNTYRLSRDVRLSNIPCERLISLLSPNHLQLIQLF